MIEPQLQQTYFRKIGNSGKSNGGEFNVFVFLSRIGVYVYLFAFSISINYCELWIQIKCNLCIRLLRTIMNTEQRTDKAHGCLNYKNDQMFDRLTMITKHKPSKERKMLSEDLIKR